MKQVDRRTPHQEQLKDPQHQKQDIDISSILHHLMYMIYKPSNPTIFIGNSLDFILRPDSVQGKVMAWVKNQELVFELSSTMFSLLASLVTVGILMHSFLFHGI